MGNWELAVMAMIGSSAMGYLLAENERSRVRYVQAMRRCMMRMNDVIRYEQPPLSVLLRRIVLYGTPQEKQLTALLKATAERIDASSNPQLALLFSDECAKSAGYGALSRDDRMEFEHLLSELGRTGMTDQLRLIEAAEVRLSQREQELSETCTRKMRLIRTLGITGGAALFLILV